MNVSMIENIRAPACICVLMNDRLCKNTFAYDSGTRLSLMFIEQK